MPANNPMQVLIQEHDVISATEQVIYSLNNSWEDNPEKYAENVGLLLTFFKEYSDQYHHHKEEAILFRELNDNPDFLQKDIISELEYHHQQFRETVVEIREAVTKGEWSQTQELLEDYINDLLDHIAVENDELFQIAETVLNASQLERMYFLFEDIDQELGLERKQALANFWK